MRNALWETVKGLLHFTLVWLPPSPQFLAGCCSGYFPEEDEGKGLSFPVKKKGERSPSLFHLGN